MYNTIALGTFLALLFLGPGPLSHAAEKTKDPLIVNISASPETLAAKGQYSIQLNLQLPKGYHAYEDQFKVTFLEPSGMALKKITLTPLKTWFDKFSKKERSGVEGTSSMELTIETPDRFVDDNGKIAFELVYQACSDSICLFPKSKDIFIPTSFGTGKKIEIGKMPDDISLFSSNGFTYFLGQSMFLGLFLAFLAGIITSFTPCIFPMIPITLAILNNHSVQRSRLANFIISVVYVLGIATTYSSLGILAAKSGMLFGSLLSNSYVVGLMCTLFFLMALSMYGVFEFQVPSFIAHRFGQGTRKSGYFGAYISGIFAGIVASPCVGPVLVSILTYVSTKQSTFLGFLLLFSYALGLGTIFIVLGASTELLKKLPRSGPWLEGTKFVLGSMMLGGFFYYFDFIVTDSVFKISLGLTLVTIASLYGAFLTPVTKKLHLVQKGLMQALLVLGIALIVMAATGFGSPPSSSNAFQDVKFDKNNIWEKWSEQAVMQARMDKKPVIIDFFAEWCAACLELDEHVFSTSEFAEKAKNIVLLKMDATKDSAELNELKKKYSIVGLPTILFIGSDGTWNKSKTLSEFENKDAFFRRLDDFN